MTVNTILVVDDQPELREPIRRRLSAEGYQVLTAGDGADALRRFSTDRPDAVVLDLMLPQLDGLTVCRCIRAQSSVPILILSAKAEEADVVNGLDQGADDYLTKPFRINELIARIRALLRRKTPASQAERPAPARAASVLATPRVRVDSGSCEVRVDGRPVALTPVEFRLLRELMKQPGKVFSRQVLLEAIWGYDGYDLGLVNTHIKRLRDRVEKDPAHPQVILTVRGFGYKVATE